jgi:hypothetical protein
MLNVVAVGNIHRQGSLLWGECIQMHSCDVKIFTAVCRLSTDNKGNKSSSRSSGFRRDKHLRIYSRTFTGVLIRYPASRIFAAVKCAYSANISYLRILLSNEYHTNVLLSRLVSAVLCCIVSTVLGIFIAVFVLL